MCLGCRCVMESSEYLLVFLHSFVLQQELGYMDSGEERQVIRKETIAKKGNRSELGGRSEAQWLQAERVIIFYGSFA